MVVFQIGARAYEMIFMGENWFSLFSQPLKKTLCSTLPLLNGQRVANIPSSARTLRAPQHQLSPRSCRTHTVLTLGPLPAAVL